ncbi:transmembrane protein 181-like [Rhopilema esculentum]|uniref:transmembrane protein 181-like n=1 Tax=Rhopilema esculentum TaxID=499914 RepID=UPI0031D1F5AF
MAHPKLRQLESSVQMRLYTLTKRQFVLVFVGFFSCFVITFIIGLAGPPIISQNTLTARQLDPKVNLMTGPFKMESGMLTVFNQQLWLLCKLQISGLRKKEFTFEKQFRVFVKIMGRNKHTSSYKLLSQSFHNRTRTIKCTVKGCEHFVVLHISNIEHPSYQISIRFHELSFPSVLKVRNILFMFKYYNAEFTQIEIWFRFAFLVLSFTVTCLFAHTLKRFPLREWTIEQKWMSLLLPLLLLYDDPIFPLNFLLHSWIPLAIDAVFQVTFLAAMLMFWLCAFHGIRQSERTFVGFYLPKIMIVGIMWVIGCVLLGWQQHNELFDPSYQYKVDIGHFVGLKIFFFIVGGIYLLYLIILIVKAYFELRNMPYFDVRVKFLTGLMLSVVAISLTATGMRFGTAIVQDNFVAEITTQYQNSAEFLCFYGLFNFYLYTMAFVYSPSKSAVKDALNRDNTSFTMLYDSDEDVIYGRKSSKRGTPKEDKSEEEDAF